MKQRRRHQVVNVGSHHNQSQSSQIKIASHTSLTSNKRAAKGFKNIRRRRHSQTATLKYFIYRISFHNAVQYIFFFELSYVILSHVTCYVHVHANFCAIWKRAVPPTKNPALLSLYWELEGQQQFVTSIWAGFGAGSGLCLGLCFGEGSSIWIYMDPIW